MFEGDAPKPRYNIGNFVRLSLAPAPKNSSPPAQTRTPGYSTGHLEPNLESSTSPTKVKIRLQPPPFSDPASFPTDMANTPAAGAMPNMLGPGPAPALQSQSSLASVPLAPSAVHHQVKVAGADKEPHQYVVELAPQINAVSLESQLFSAAPFHAGQMLAKRTDHGKTRSCTKSIVCISWIPKLKDKSGLLSTQGTQVLSRAPAPAPERYAARALSTVQVQPSSIQIPSI
ncbi:hypothetical protein LTR70_001642 [Exophiala xenobiotica]|uniref:Uncharacterized protein n=1 Tax=Lithohypha guttulata TaxID=1690604 RepID=A0ABR0KHC2_9EURO|nr:hypothetical protein LTR24_002533 [Lithohypha guttulata]KAK5327167.1 hypothetical protein LTR70_001642 [Exophiala xenobiotica]